MKRQSITKTVLGLMIFVFVVLSFGHFSETQAATNSMSNLYSNPNQGGAKNPFKFKVSDVVNSNILTNVVGCTGVVNKVSTWMTNFLQSPLQKAKMAEERLSMVTTQLESACSSTKASAEGAAGVIPWVNDLVKTVDTIFSKISVNVSRILGEAGTSGSGGKTREQICLDQVKAINKDQMRQMIKDAERENEVKTKEQCLDGIAITLARNQLTSMTRSMMNWVNSGFGGNPFFVQNMRNFTTNIENNVIETGIDALLSPGTTSPYARDFARSRITHRGIVSDTTTFLGSLQSDLEYFITDPRSYYTYDTLGNAQDTRTALQRAQDANNAFEQDFAVGGWNAWLALTQRDQNNPLGYSMLADQYLANIETQAVSNAKDELTQNGGFLSQKKCVRWQVKNEDGSFKSTNGTGVFSNTEPEFGVCDRWQVITPGSLIKEKVTSYLNSPERQLELADTINDALNALFSVLLSKLEGGGLSGLSDATNNTSNWTDELNNLSDYYTSPDGNTPYDNNGAYDGFNLTRDLGNTYLHVEPVLLGEWDAKSNITSTGQKLYPNIGPVAKDTNGILITSNTYFRVNVPGETKLIDNGYNYWAVGDRAFWDGEKWQNWQNGQANPLKNRGVIQIQEDYIVAAKEMMKVLPKVMSSLGELDYCLPGPNPSYKTNSTDAQSAYQDWVSSMYVGMTDTTNKRFGVKIDGVGSRTYEDLHSIYLDNPNVWARVKGDAQYTIDRNIITLNQRISGVIGDGMQYLLTNFSNICNNKTGLGKSCLGNYTYADPLTSLDNQHLEEKRRLMDLNLSYVNDSMFQNFYEVFDRMMDKIYFNNITQKYIEHEDEPLDTVRDINPDYIEMAQSGYDITRDMVTYNSDIEKAMASYTDAINQAKINISKLEPIRAEVSQIIAAAQDRRNERLLQQIIDVNAQTFISCQMEFNSCLASHGLNPGSSPSNTQYIICRTKMNQCIQANGGILNETTFKQKYAECLDEESIKVFDADAITNNNSSAEGRCDNGIDDDLDGLVDRKDPDCSPNNNTNITYIPITFYFELSPCSNPTQYVQAEVTTTYASNTTPPTASSIFGSGARVQGGTNVFYAVRRSGTEPIVSDTEPFDVLKSIGTVTGVSGAIGCPSQIVTPPDTGNTCTPPAIYDQATNSCITCTPPSYYYMGSCYNPANTQQTYTVTATVYNNTGGTITTPLSKTITNTYDNNGQVTYGSVNFEIVPSPGYAIDPYGWSGTCIPVSLGVANRYTVGGSSRPILSDCNFTVTFRQI